MFTVRCSLLAVLTLLAASAGLAEAKRTIVLLDFGGKHAKSARTRILRFLKKTYNVYPGLKLVETCEKLGLAVKRGHNLATCAQRLRAIAVVGGTIAAGKLHLAVYSGKTGQPLQSGSVPWKTPPTSSNISEALRLLASGLSRAPASVEPEKPRTEASARSVESDPPPVEVTAKPAPPRSPAKPPSKRPAPPPARSGVVDDGGGGAPVYDPSQIATGVDTEGATSGNALDEIDPLGDLSGIGGGYGAGVDGKVEEGEDYIEEGAPPPSDDKAQRERRLGIEATAGLGALLRIFSTSKPVGPPLEYNSGVAFALRLGAKARPLAFFRRDWSAGLFARVDSLLTIGLQSSQDTSSASSTMGTSVTQVVVDLGWEWLVLEAPTGPHVDFSLGFGLLDFSVDWPATVQDRNFPNSGYRFALARLGGSYPIDDHFAAQVRADYRLVLDSGEIEDPDTWYGDAFVGGIGAAAGIGLDYSGFIASIEYRFAYYFYAFSGDRNARYTQGLRAAGGASDLYNTFWLNIGYGF